MWLLLAATRESLMAISRAARESEQRLRKVAADYAMALTQRERLRVAIRARELTPDRLGRPLPEDSGQG